MEEYCVQSTSIPVATDKVMIIPHSDESEELNVKLYYKKAFRYIEG